MTFRARQYCDSNKGPDEKNVEYDKQNTSYIAATCAQTEAEFHSNQCVYNGSGEYAFDGTVRARCFVDEAKDLRQTDRE
jgi:hypothetical protein